MQSLVQIVRRGGRVQPRPEHPGKHITVSPVAAGESQQLDALTLQQQVDELRTAGYQRTDQAMVRRWRRG